MKIHHRNLFAILTVVLTTSVPADAATNFNGISTDLISDATKWTNGLPADANPGTISVASRYSSAVTHTGYNVVHSAGLLALSGTGAFALSGSTWTMNGTATYSGRGIALTNSSSYTVDLGVGTANFSNNNVDISIASGSTMLVSSGNVLGGRSLLVSGGTFTMNSGGNVTFSTTSTFGATGLGANGIMNLNAGSITATRLALRGGTDVNFGGSVAGAATFDDWGTGVYTATGDRAQDNNFTLDFNPTSLMTLTLSSTARALDFTNDSINNPTGLPWAEALWGQNQLFYSGQSATALGLTWADVTTTGFGDGKAFDFDQLGSFGGTLHLVAIPEPTGISLLSLALGTAVLIRRRPRA